MNRSTAYVVLGFLIKRGFVSISDIKSVRLYTPASPDRLVRLAQESANKHNELVGITKTLLPKLKSMQNKTEQKPRVQFFDGDEGIKAVQQEVVRSKGIIMMIHDQSKDRGHQPSAEISIFDNRIAFIAPTEKFALIIQSNELAGSLKTICKLSLKKSTR
jgi:sugar-specific transcriptional regulator TrmB